MKEKELIFSMLRQMADAITNTFGENCEVAIHDLENITESLVYITGSVTQRELGAPTTDVVMKEFVEHGASVEDMYGFKTITDDGRELKSTTLYIRNSEDKVLAAFCINFDVTDYLNAIQAMSLFAGIKKNKGSQKISEKMAFSIDHTIETLFEEAVVKIGKRPGTMTTDDKTKLVQILEEKGVFQIKGVVGQVALQLGVSTFTVYNYLKKIRAGNRISVPSVVR